MCCTYNYGNIVNVEIILNKQKLTFFAAVRPDINGRALHRGLMWHQSITDKHKFMSSGLIDMTLILQCICLITGVFLTCRIEAINSNSTITRSNSKIAGCSVLNMARLLSLLEYIVPQQVQCHIYKNNGIILI